MKTPLISLGFVLITCASFSMQQDVQTDTTKQISTEANTTQDKVNFGPVYGTRNISDLGYYAVTVDDPKLFHLSAGMSVLNTLRGQGTGLNITAQAPGATASLRSGSPMYVIDGLPFNNIDGHYNFNASEYQSVTAINSGNAAARYGGAGINSVVLLQRKNGTGISRPTFDFSSYTTFSSNKLGNDEEAAPVDRWMFTNSVAYAQDFGAIDTRVSYTYSRFPSADKSPTETDIHTTSINTGLELNRFTARLILDQYAALSEMNQSSTFGTTTTEFDYSGKATFLQGNLAMSYQLAKGLNLTSQAAISRTKDRDALVNAQLDIQAASYNRQYEHQQRSLYNLFLNGSSELNTAWKISYAAGYQIEKYNPYKDTYSYQIRPDMITEAGTTYGLEIKTKSLITDVSVNLKNYLSIAANYQHNDFDEENNDTYTFATAFTFSEAFNWKGNGFSLGRIRANYGKTDIMNNANFPLAFSDSFYPSTTYLPVAGSNFEFGTDFGFMNDRITLTVNRYYNMRDDLWTWLVLPWGPNGYGYQLVNIGELKQKGWEFMVGAKIFTAGPVNWSAKLNLYTFKTIIEGQDLSPSGDEASNEWLGGLLNQFEYKNWFVSFLIDTHKNGKYFDLEYDNGIPVTVVKDVSQTKLRDLSVGYSVPLSSPGTVVKAVRVSLSARNIWTIYNSADSDRENTIGNYTNMKTVSASIGVTF